MFGATRSLRRGALREVEQHTHTHTARLTSRRRGHDSPTSESPRPGAIVKQCTVTWEEVGGRGRHESVERTPSGPLQRTHEHTHSDRGSPHTHTHTHTHTPCARTHTHTLTHAHRHPHTRLLAGPEHTCELCCRNVVKLSSRRQIMQLARRFTDLRHPFVDTFSHTQRTHTRHRPSAGPCREAHSPCCPVCFCALLAEIPASALAKVFSCTQRRKGGVPLR